MAFNFKKLLKARVIAWAATTVLLVAVLIVANDLGNNRFRGLLDGVFGGDTANIDPDSKARIDQEFGRTSKDKAEALSNGNALVREICEEGMVLLKNDNVLPMAEGANVSVFGKNSVNLVYGGSGSAAPGNGARKTIFDSLKEANINYNESLKTFYESKASGDGRSSNPAMENSGVSTLKTGETPYADYPDNVKSSYTQYGDAALVVFSRIAGENWDLPRVASDDPTRHYLELDNNERELLRQIGQSGKFQRIIILMNGSNYIDLGFLKEETNPTDYNDFGKYVNGAIVIGSPGAEGIMALGKILTGKVNPSGHTVDTVYTKYSEDPTWQNFGGNFEKDGDAYLNQQGAVPRTSYFFVEYEENIYLGYRYYETRGQADPTWYQSHVVYPFGYGLSYSTFTQEIANKAELQAAALNANETFDVKVKVKNISAVPGKQVIQVYAEPKYINGGIEKSSRVLVGFAKTKLLGQNEEQELTINVNPYDFASFDSKDKNNNNFKGYELDAGDYVFHVATDVHTDIEAGTFTKNLAANAKFEKDPVTQYDVKVLFPEVTSAMNEQQSLSRADNNFDAKFPKLVTTDERKKDDAFFKKLASLETTNNEVFDKVATTGVNNNVKFKELAGKSYDDPLWDKFLDQMTFDEMLKLFNDACYSTAPIERLGVTKTTSADGPTGLVAFLGDPAVYDTCYYQSECLLAQTYNVELAEKQGLSIGEECLVGNEKGDKLSYPGWYAPGVNLHRSPFSGRNTEYYSEDPFLSGRFAGKVIKSVQSKGVYANVKHFALNDQETHRSKNGIATWCDEQAMRELYLRPFEMAVKEGGTRGLMTSFNRIGTEWAGGSYRLVTTILRNEWGFRGTVICDFHTDKYMDSKQMLYAGGDVNLCSDKNIKLSTSKKYRTPTVSPKDAKDVGMLRRSAHNTLFALVNSNGRVDVKSYNPATWRVLLYVGTGVVAGALAVWGFLAIFTALRKKDKDVPQAE